MYDFDVDAADTANPVGCGVDEHPITCLCDVHMSLSPDPSGRLGPLPCTADDFANHMAFELEKFEVLQSILKAGCTCDELLWFADQVNDLLGWVGVGRAFARNREVGLLLSRMLRGGLNVHAVGRLTFLDPEDVVRYMGRLDLNRDEASVYVRLDEVCRGPFPTFTELGETIGLPRETVREWCHMVGIQRGFDGAKARLVELHAEGGMTMREMVEQVNLEFGTTWSPNAGHQVMNRARRLVAA